MIPVPLGARVWLAVGHTDIRRGMNSLALQVQEGYRQVVASGQLNLRHREWGKNSSPTDTADFGPDLEFCVLEALSSAAVTRSRQRWKVVDLIVGEEKALRLVGRFELFHLSFSTACRLV
jgi:hypothetical protein